MSKFVIEDRHYEAYYGVVPDNKATYNSQFSPLIKSILEMIHKKYPKITLETADKGLLAGLKYLNNLNEINEFNEYSQRLTITRLDNNLRLKGSILKAASAAIVSKLEAVRTREYIDANRLDDKEIKEREKAQGTTLALYESFKKQVGYWKKSGLPDDDALVEAYKGVLKDNPSPQGKTMLDLVWGIPIEYGIYNRDEVVNAVNAHPVLPNRKKASQGRKYDWFNAIV